MFESSAKWVFGIGHWVLDIGCWVLDVSCWALGIGRWVLAAGCWVLGTRYWVWDVETKCEEWMQLFGVAFALHSLRLWQNLQPRAGSSSWASS